jgi:hypothetical protein
MTKKPRIAYTICVPPPNVSDSIEQWTKHQAQYRPFVEDGHAAREVQYASAVIEWKLGGEQGPPPQREIPPLLLAPKLRRPRPT